MTPSGNRKSAAPFLMAGFEGTAVSPWLAARLRDGTVGGVVLFARNVAEPAQVRDLCREIRAAAGPGRPAPLIAIDQEGGRVRRLKDPRFTQFPPVRSIALLGPRAERAAEKTGAFMAAELTAVGIDINFAPVLDVDPDPGNWAVGDRSFSGDPETAARLGVAFLRGSLRRKVLPVGKHFPGHGHADADSHEKLPVVRNARNTLLARDLLPFRRAIAAGIPALMSAHVVYPALDREHPATLSRKILRGLLREDLGFRGVVFSDALEMKAISGEFGMGTASVLALRAGCDVAMVCHGEADQAEAVEALARESADSADFRKTVALANRRIARLRAGLPAPQGRRPSLRPVGAKSHRELAALLSARWEESAGRTSPAGRSDNIGER